MASSAPALYRRIAASRVRARFQYRASFFASIIGSFLFSFVDFVLILVVFNHVGDAGLGEWSFTEVGFLYGGSYAMFKTADMLMANLDKLPQLIRLGTFDQILTRPLGTLGQVLTGDVDARHVGGVLQGTLVFAVSVGRLSIDWTPQRVAVLVSMMVSGIAIFSAIWVATNAVAFWTTDGREIANSFTYGGNMITQFPINILGTWFRRVFAYAIPLVFVNYLPGLYILDKPDPLGLPPSLRFASPLAALASAGVAALIWRAAVRRYRSTGS